MLVVLSVLGVLAGMFFRVQAYLFAGVAFLCLTVFTQIWHAAYDLEQSWLWWACGVVLGAAILALFALFEKRRPEVLAVMNEIKQWR